MPAIERTGPEGFLGTGHVLGRLGMRFDGEGFRLPVAPVLRDPDGHLTFGALGVLLDMASSTAFRGEDTGHWVHADITVHRLRPPADGEVLATARVLRRGKRTGVVELDLVDAAGDLVAASTQQCVFLGLPAAHPDAGERARAAFESMFDGRCRFDAPVAVELGVREVEPGTWTMDHGPDRTNGLSGLHGGVATTLVDAAAAGAVAARRGAPARTVSAAVRYLVPALHGPFRATPQVLHDDGAVAVVRTPVRDAEGTTVISADVQVA